MPNLKLKKWNSRSIHRCLSFFVGIQLLLWTSSGLIFSWNPIQKVRGEHMIRKQDSPDFSKLPILSLPQLKARNAAQFSENKVSQFEVRPLIGKPVFDITFVLPSGFQKHQVFDAITGTPVSPISKEIAKQVAINDFSENTTVRSVERVDSVGSHSEYRGKKLPAYRVRLEHPSATVIYVSVDQGIVTTRRNNRWRLFDFFWMIHTMDYQGRDNFNSWLLKSVSLLGLMTVISGYWLWWRSSLIRIRWRGRRAAGE